MKNKGTKVEQHRAVAYVRVSTEDQRQGPKAQRDAIERFAAREDLEIVSWHVDHGVSGAAPLDERPALGEALLGLRPGYVLLVAKRDRLSRDMAATVAIDAAVRKSRARILSADGFANDDTPENEFMRNIQASVAVYERQLIRSRTKAALQAKKARGERVGVVPFGFKLAKDGVHIANDTRESAVVDRVLELRAEGLGVRRIARACSKERLMSRGKKPLQETQVQRILWRTER